MAYRIAAILTTLSDVQGHSTTTSLSKCDYSFSRAAFDKCSTASRGLFSIAELLVVFGIVLRCAKFQCSEI